MTMRSWLVLLLVLMSASASQAQTREQKVRADREKFEKEGFWIYNDLPRAIEQARRENKPILAVLRCIPCEECVKLDDELVASDPHLRPLLEKFVRVRIVSTNGLDLGLFQFDTDQSFAAFLLHPDGTIYGRYGTRSHRTSWSDDVSIAGLAKALEGALELHARHPEVKSSLAAKRGPAPAIDRPEKLPGLREKYKSTLDYAGNVVRSCIHCHQIGDAIRDQFRRNKEPIPEQVLFPFPHPRTVGLVLSPRERATVVSVKEGSPAEAAGLQAGDELLELAGQPMLSIADVQWVLHNARPEGDSLKLNVRRGEKQVELLLTLVAGWRRQDDLSWRVSSWGLRRMGTGGLVLKQLPWEDRQRLKLDGEAMALVVEHVGEFGEHAAGKNAGFRKGDVIVSFDGRRDLRRETELLAHAVTQRRPGDVVEVAVLRNGEQLTLKLPMQR